MKLIIDAQLPSKLCEILESAGISSIHVDKLAQGDETPDHEISQYADERGMVVLTKDIDFYHAHMTLGIPKKLFLVTTGNIKNRQLFDLFRDNIELIRLALDRSSFIELSNEGIIERS